MGHGFIVADELLGWTPGNEVVSHCATRRRWRLPSAERAHAGRSELDTLDVAVRGERSGGEQAAIDGNDHPGDPARLVAR